jgi:ketosteroid isomerase-like protein
MAELIADDCEWRTFDGRKEAYSGPAGVLEYVDDQFGTATSATISEYAFREVGDTSAVSGSLNVVEAGGAIVQRQVHWIFQVRDGKVRRAQSFARRDDALAAAEALGEPPPQAG